MTLKTILPLAAVLGAMFCAVTVSLAQIWTTNIAIGGSCVASSAGGNVLAVAASSRIYISTNSGVTWTTNSLPSTCLAVSADGSKLVVGSSSPGAIYTSTNSGITWLQQSNPPSYGAFNNLRAIASSADGNKLVAVLYGTCPVFTSTNSGVTWTTNSAPISYWTAVASSPDGNKLFAVNTGIWESTNSGISWMSNNAPILGGYSAIASSADGTIILAAIGGGGIYSSTDSGATWASNGVPSEPWAAIASSASGSRVVAVCYGGIYSSTNSGLAWVSNSVPFQVWNSVAASADGMKFVALTSGRIFTRKANPNPQLDMSSSSTNLVVSWLIPSTNFVVQQSSDLSSWSSTTDTPTLNLTNLQYQVSHAPSNNSGFFRLVSQ